MHRSAEELHEQDLERQLKACLEHSTDFSTGSFAIGDRKVNAYYLPTLVDLPSTLALMRQASTAEGSIPDVMLSFGEERKWSAEELSLQVLRGKLVLFESDGKLAVMEPERPNLNRSIAYPETENPLQSSFDAFTENLDMNIGLLRRKMTTTNLVVETRFVGSHASRKLAVVYLRGMANEQVVHSITETMVRNSGREVSNVRNLLDLLEQPSISVMPTYLTTELSGEAVQLLLDGKVLVLVDQFPHACAFPAVVTDLWAYKLDFNFPYLFALFFRIIRVCGIVFALTMPGLYIVMNSVNPELLRIQLAISVARSREGVPYPSLIEMLLMLLLLEMVVEASIRLPRSIGPTVTMVGGIILGQAIVQAKLVSNLLIIVLAASTIANFTMPGYLNTVGIRIYKYFVILLSSMFGIWGLEAAIIWLCFHLAGLKTFSVPYLSANAKGKRAG